MAWVAHPCGCVHHICVCEVCVYVICLAHYLVESLYFSMAKSEPTGRDNHPRIHDAITHS